MNSLFHSMIGTDCAVETGKHFLTYFIVNDLCASHSIKKGFNS